MKFYEWDTLGRTSLTNALMIENEYYGDNYTIDIALDKSESIKNVIPQDAALRYEELHSYQFHSLLGNTSGRLIVSTALKDLLLQESSHPNLECINIPVMNPNDDEPLTNDYWLINPVGSYDVLDMEKSRIRYKRSKPEEIRRVEKVVLDSVALEKVPHIFRATLVEDTFYISEELLIKIEDAGCTNISVTAMFEDKELKEWQDKQWGFYSVCEDGSVAEVDEYLKAGHHIEGFSAQFPQRQSAIESTLLFVPLCVAAQNGNTKVVKHLISRGADVNRRNLNDLAPLHYALWCNKFPATKALLAAEADINAQSPHGSVIECAFHKLSPKNLEFILHAGALFPKESMNPLKHFEQFVEPVKKPTKKHEQALELLTLLRRYWDEQTVMIDEMISAIEQNISGERAPLTKEDRAEEAVITLYKQIYGESQNRAAILSTDPSDYDMDPALFYDLLPDLFGLPMDAGHPKGCETILESVTRLCALWDGKEINDVQVWNDGE